MSQRKMPPDWVDYAFLFVLIFVMIRLSNWLESQLEDQFGNGLVSFLLITVVVIAPLAIVSGVLYRKVRGRS